MLAQGQEIQIQGPSQAVAVKTPAQQLVSQIRSDAFKQQIADALPEDITPERFVRITATALLTNPKLAEDATPDSLLSSIIRCAQDGLYPDGHDAALVVFKGKAQYMPMVGGFRKIAAEHGWALRGFVVYENDEFEYTLGDKPTVTHRPPRMGADRGAKIGAYATATHRDGRTQFLPMTAAEIAKVRKVSRAADKGPWVDWEEQMWEKTPVRRLFKNLALDPGDRRVAGLLAAAEGATEETMTVMYGPSGGDFVTPPKMLEPADDATEASGQQASVEAGSPPADTDAPGQENSAVDPEAAVREQTADTAEQEPGQTGGEAVAPAPTPEPVIEVPIPEILPLTDDEREVLLPTALAMNPPSGSYQTKTLGWVFALGDAADQWLAYALRQPWPQDPVFKQALELACRAERPEMYAAWKQETA